MGEEFLGGVAGGRIGRYALPGDSFRSRPGYGVYFTDRRIIGLSYAKILSRSYYPAYLLGLASFSLLTSAVVYAKLTGVSDNQQLPLGIVLVPIFFGLAGLSIIFLYYWPRQIGMRISHNAPKSLLELSNQSPDVVLERADISQVSVEGCRINILTRSNQWCSFFVRVPGILYSKPLRWKGQSGQLLAQLQKFCSLDPPISIFVKEKREWKLLQ